jgi:methionine-rich copper-binding protein CopC
MARGMARAGSRNVAYTAAVKRRHNPGLVRSIIVALFLFVLSPGVVAAHSELVSSSPADGATVPSPFFDLIELQFSEALADGSKAELFEAPFKDPETGAEVSPLLEDATVDGPGAKMTFPRMADLGLGSGTFNIKWTSIAEDGDLLRGTITFTVAPAPPSPTPTPELTPSPSAVALETASPTEATTVSPSVSASATPTDASPSSTTGDVIIPIVVGLIVVGAGAAYLLSRRNRPTTSG